MHWKPISENEFDALLIAESAELSEDARKALRKFGIGRVPMQIVRRRIDGGAGVPERVFVVARLANSVLFYDDVEEEFAVATIDTDEVIRDWSLWGALDFGLKNFPHAGPVRGPWRSVHPDGPI